MWRQLKCTATKDIKIKLHELVGTSILIYHSKIFRVTWYWNQMLTAESILPLLGLKKYKHYKSIKYSFNLNIWLQYDININGLHTEAERYKIIYYSRKLPWEIHSMEDQEIDSLNNFWSWNGPLKKLETWILLHVTVRNWIEICLTNSKTWMIFGVLLIIFSFAIQ